MKRVLGLFFMALAVVVLAGFVKPVQAMPEADARVIVDAAYGAVQNTLEALEAANAAGDPQQIDQALQALDLAVKNYGVASGNLSRMQAGEALDDTALTNSYVLADKLSIFSAQFLKNDLAGAGATFAEAQRLAAALPPPAAPGGIPAGLANLESRIIAVSAASVSALRSAGAPGGGEGGPGRIGTNSQVGSPI